MFRYPEPLENLINALSRLPGIGIKTAERLSYYIVRTSKKEAEGLCGAIKEAIEKIRHCSICSNITDEKICNICSSAKRDRTTICVVENPADIIALESSDEYKGLYHVLMGSLSPLNGIEPENLRINELVERVEKFQIKEIILALDPDVEGEATAFYIKSIFNNYPVKITQLAYGIPMGGNLEFTDSITLGRAIEGRRDF